MISKKEIYFEKNTPFHIISRAVEGKEIYLKEDDALRFIFQMYAANVGSPGRNLHREDIKKVALAILNGEKISPKFIIVEHAPLVSFFSFVLVITHHHFILISNIEGGISKYLQKSHGGFAKFYNLKYGRKDVLFERQYKIIPIQTNFQLDAVLRYVNVKNPLDVYQPGWREKGLKDEKNALKFLNEYRFSSFPDLFGNRNSQILASRSILEKCLGKEITKNKADFSNFIKDYLQENLAIYNPFFLEE